MFSVGVPVELNLEAVATGFFLRARSSLFWAMISRKLWGGGLHEVVCMRSGTDAASYFPGCVEFELSLSTQVAGGDRRPPRPPSHDGFVLQEDVRGLGARPVRAAQGNLAATRLAAVLLTCETFTPHAGNIGPSTPSPPPL